MADKILTNKADGIAWLTFNNPEKRNAITSEMWQSLDAALEDFENDRAVRVMIMRGAGGRSFVSGADISQFEKHRNDADQSAVFAKASTSARHRMSSLSKPLIAAIQGYCMGGGVRIALAADIRVASADSVFGIPAVKLGLGYSLESAVALVSVVGPTVAKEMLFTGRRLDAAEAQQIGLVNRVVPADQLESAVLELAQEISRNAPLAVRAAKIVIDQAVLDADKRDIARVEAAIRACFDSKDYAIGRRAFLEKRTPEFLGE